MPPELLPPERRSLSWKRLAKLLAGLFSALVLIALLFPAHSGCGPIGKSARAKHEIMGLVTAIKQYYTEYGRYPELNGGRIEDESTQARLLQILRAEDQNHTLNPRRVLFFETKEAQKEGRWGDRKYVSGIHPKTGALIDPWGRPYRIRLDAAYANKVESPYKDGEEIRSPVLVWSLGKDGIQGSPGKENVLEKSDDVVSWK